MSYTLNYIEITKDQAIEALPSSVMEEDEFITWEEGNEVLGVILTQDGNILRVDKGHTICKNAQLEFQEHMKRAGYIEKPWMD